MAAERAAAVALVLLALAGGAASQSNPLFPASNKGLRPTRLTTFGITHYYQLAKDPVGTVAFFHGCARSARNFFPYDPTYCPECLGLPEHISHTKQALARGYNVLALDPDDQRVLCWSSSDNPPYINDQPQAIATLRYFVTTQNLTSLPVFLWGCSSGGTLAMKLMRQLRENDQIATQKARAAGVDQPYTLWGTVQGVIAEASTQTEFDAADASGQLTVPGFPPVIYVRMARDGAEKDVATNMAFFRRNGIPSDVMISPVRKITPTYFSDRSTTMTPDQSAKVLEAMQKIGIVNSTGYVTANPKDFDNPQSLAYRWTAKLQAALPWLTPTSKSLSLVLRASPIFQEMAVAWAWHDAVSDYFTACLAWLESRGTAKASVLASQYVVPNFKLSDLTPDRKYTKKVPGASVSPSPPPPDSSASSPPPPAR